VSTLRLGLNMMGPTANFSMWGTDVDPALKMVRFAEEVGFDSVWTAEASGTDAVVPLTWMAAHTEKIKLGTAILQMTGRTPPTTAMTAVTFDKLSRGRFILGLGASGPGVVEGWHSEAYGDPLQRTREYVDIVRRLTSQRRPLKYRGEYYQLPYCGPDATGLASPIQLMVRSRRRRIPIYLAAMGPKNLELAAKVADGIILPLYTPFRDQALFGALRDKFGEGGLEVCPFVPILCGDNVDECLDTMRPVVAFWLGGMGVGGVNFYNRYAQRLGFPEVVEVRAAYARGDMRAAGAAVPKEFIDEVCLCGPLDRIKERIEVWRESACTTMVLTGGVHPDLMSSLAEMVR
jgi:F420-dependent oxidoreductase-like protein